MVRIIVTGGSGKAGRHVIPYLIAQGHTVMNLDIIPFPDPKVPVYTLKTDLTNSGQVFNAFTSLFNMEEYQIASPGPPLVPDVVIHLAAYARNMLVPDNELFNGNTQSTYNVIEVACKLGIKKIMICSSETTYSVCFWQGERDYDVFPLEEDYDVNPMDTYALTKIIGEKTARAFANRFQGTDIYAFRVGNVIEPHEKRNAFSYIDARDLGQIFDKAIQKSGLGFQMDEYEAPLSNKKIRDVLGFEDVHDWRSYVDVEAVKKEMKK
ncbi:hypothetical protein QFC20_006342 [Naganishia adeliensis]|uniref:Uncharacterized protein n=1 Tax=Naganishia adeliensis TaxID=92952 RepID=A0ACC2VCS1_9TREE|nr:hypothetical protein QFC20_006342 [Naganishia adeliensis]